MAMARVKTQVYLTRRQHRELVRAARRHGISLAEMVRRMADSYLDRAPARQPSPRALRGIVGLFRSGVADTASHHHRVLDDLLRRGPAR